MANPAWDTLIRNALVFDGTGSAPTEQDIAIKGGRIAAPDSGPRFDPYVFVTKVSG